MKALRKSKKQYLRNKNAIESIRYSLKQFEKYIAGRDEAKSKEQATKIVKLIDKAVQKSILKMNGGARKKSRLWKKFHQAFRKKS